MRLTGALVSFWAGIFMFGAVFFLMSYILGVYEDNLTIYYTDVWNLINLVAAGIIALGTVAWAYRHMSTDVV